MSMPPPPLPEAPESTSTSTEVPITEAHTLLTSFSSFLTISIHTIIYYRNIYPRQTFLSAKAYNLPVHQSRHPKVCSWIRDAVDAVTGQIAAGSVARVAVVIHAPLTSSGTTPSKSPAAGGGGAAATAAVAPAAKPSKALSPGAVLERWMFDVSGFPSWPGGAEAMRNFNSAPGGGGGGGEDEQGEEGEEEEEEEEDDEAAAAADENAAAELAEEGVINWADVDEQLRGALRRLAHAGEKMAALPEGCTFTVAVELKSEAQAPIGHLQPWIPSQPSLQVSSGQRRRGKELRGANTVPVRTVEAGPLFFECWVEEGKAKEALQGSSPAQAANPRLKS